MNRRSFAKTLFGGLAALKLVTVAKFISDILPEKSVISDELARLSSIWYKKEYMEILKRQMVLSNFTLSSIPIGTGKTIKLFRYKTFKETEDAGRDSDPSVD